jgi:hypothetical protein
MLCNKNTNRRARRRRDSRVVYPPVDIARFHQRPSEDFFLMVPEMVPCKRLDYAIKLFGATGIAHKSNGSFPEPAKDRLSRDAGSALPRHALHSIYATLHG